ncbi:MAG: M23 family metallopeptidase [Clostridia bacterium]|nr:M23 family metallopeptidase [Clostridia bacterium]
MNDRMDDRRIVVTQMHTREKRDWTNSKPEKPRKRLHRPTPIFAAAFLCLCAGGAALALSGDGTQAVMSHLTAGFEYDQTLGRLQFVSNILPESAMVFLTQEQDTGAVVRPVSAQAEHDWSQSEPWFEYACSGDVVACREGEVMTVVRNRKDEYTIRVLHSGGYESVYSGLCAVDVGEDDYVSAGQKLGSSDGFAAFELRRDGLSVNPVFGET